MQATAAAKLPTGSAQEQYDYAFGLLRAADYANAEVALGTFIKSHPDNSLTSNAHYWLGETYYVRGKYGDAAAAFARAADSAQSSKTVLAVSPDPDA